MRLQTYNSFLTGKKTWLIVSQGKCGYIGYREYQILFKDGSWHCYRTNGYDLDVIGTYAGSKGIKSVINLIWGK